MSHQANPVLDISAIGQDVLDVFCDVVAKDGAKENEGIRIDNEKLQPIRENLIHAQLFNSGDKVATINLGSYDDEDQKYYVYHVEAEVPHEKMRHFLLRLSGVDIPVDFFSDTPKISISGETIHAKMECLDIAVLEGTLQNQHGSLEVVQEMIDTNQAAMYFSFLGMVSADTGLPVRLMPFGSHGCFAGSIFKLSSIKISKHVAGKSSLPALARG
ncbi:expressed unknown protein [Seminavis robusta]|uniref:Uncharacterized protein n=1 Tax=Seminavis robusta TaxID=568900 RepID=A0A9N8HD27_9STRA|nr:expressed unknown protein [Seminavis robusta]|eukprot:Sro440_g143380.1 n/a (215) ;mRNA; f:14724-15368